MVRNAMPAIARDVTKADFDNTVMHTFYNSVTNSPGWGDSGKKFEIVEQQCPSCIMDTMLRKYKVNAETASRVEYYCLHPNCVHYHKDDFSYATSAPTATEPKITE